MTRFRRKICLTLTVLALFILVVLKSLSPDDRILVGGFGLDIFPQERQGDGVAESHVIPETSMVKKMWKEKVVSIFNTDAQDKDFPPPNYNMHVFYYTWYGNPRFDGKYIHWNHPLLPHWNPKIALGYPRGTHKPPDDIGASFYPALGAYSSRDPSVIEVHMQQLRTAAIGVLAVSWYPSGMKDDNGEPTEDIVPLILEVAAKYKVKVVFHIEPYRGRNDKSMFENIKYIIETYGDHPAFFRYRSNSGKLLPLFYVYDSYLQSPDIWAQLLKRTGKTSIRNTPYDGIFIGLLVEEKHKAEVLAAGFDGIYTYFATNSFSYGSSQKNWRSIKAFCDNNKLIFIPSVGPGYIDTSIRPWNGQNTRNRINGKYYEMSLKAALETRPKIISVTSFNEWHEGTQIETAIPKTRGQTAYLDYLPYKPTLYLDITQRWAEKFREEQEKWLQ
ncbi:glycoprotein endo-alpha-1,2-mannosidase [Neoarius graeffei]|uniref:glycoprotein endo-alpha-1,2-mannosidase n=1 Tax=Neoarius graeffei TaxID=443677 RepID=UPI00298CFFB5|nr:glycoprotein endo-alpha-1,2-mannosidase [Neoarius graeffei]XP_060789676.1 glycoprotein endo-alpha-1,2-mannosidase [Neoarius graeffei]